MKRIPPVLLTLGAFAISAQALQFDMLATRVAEGTALSDMGAMLAFAVDGTPDATRPATLVAGPDGNPLRYHFQFDYDALYLPQQEQGHSVTYSLLAVTVCGHEATRLFSNSEYTSVVAFPINLPTTFGPDGLPFPACGSAVDAPGAPLDFHLGEAVPNPFNPETALRLTQSRAGSVRVMIVDLQGRLVDLLWDGELPAGGHDFVWRPANRASGIYLAVARAGGQVQVRRLALIK